MKHLSFKIKKDVCEAHNKDFNAVELLKAMSHYGEVVPFENEVAGMKRDYETTIENLSAQLTAIKEQELTADEIEMVRAYRKNKSAVVADCERKLNAMAETLRLGNEKLAQAKAVISAQLEKLSE